MRAGEADPPDALHRTDLAQEIGEERSATGRLTSAPRTAGTMQKAHELSQPIWMVTHAT